MGYESGAGRQDSITVVASDGTLTSSQSFTIGVTDVAPSQPTDSVAPTGGTVSEGAATGDLVGITAASSDVNGGTVTFSLSDDAGGRIDINGSTGVVTVANGSLLDYESAPGHQYSITVVASDGTLPSSQSTTIPYTALVRSQPTDSVAPTGGTVSEGAATGDLVGITAASSDVNGGTVT